MRTHQIHAPAAILESILFAAIVFGLLAGALWNGNTLPTDRFHIKDWGTSSTYLKHILKKREITVITQNSAQGYYLYRDQAMGFEYDLARAFADFLGVRLSVALADDWQEMLSILEKTHTGFIAAGGIARPSALDNVSFSNGYLGSRQYLIVHRENRAIRRIGDLTGQTIHVGNGTSYRENVAALKTRGIDMQVVFHEDVSVEELIRRVAEKTIAASIADENVALLNRRYYPQIVLADPVSDETLLQWAVHPEAEGLLAQMNLFIGSVTASGKLKEIYDRYFTSEDDFDFVDLRAYHRRLESRLPKYQAIIQREAEAHGFDWRLIAAQIYQESHFDPMATSHAGAYGLMQLTRATAELFHVTNIFDPEENIRAGVRHLKFLFDFFEEAKGMDRTYLTLAAYNIGLGHVLDARVLAQQRQLDPNSWSAISEILPLLSHPKYYKDAIHGYCRGTEPVTYVKQTMLYYDILKHQEMPWVIAFQS